MRTSAPFKKSLLADGGNGFVNVMKTVLFEYERIRIFAGLAFFEEKTVELL